jgi:chromosome segregation ATPase
MVAFEENFWGEKYNGFEVLHQNYKLGHNASKEFGEFLKERASIEEQYSKSLQKLATKCAVANTSIGTFEPCWKFLQGSTEKLANVHSQVMASLNDVAKSVQEYSEKQKEGNKTLKPDFTAMTELVANLQNMSNGLAKAKETYQQRAVEVDKCRKDIPSLKEIKTAEKKFKQTGEEYQQMAEKRETTRNSYQEKMTEISSKLQGVEEEHLKTNA